MNRSLQAILLGVLILSLDQASQQLVLEQISQTRSVEIIPGLFKLSLVTNTGAAWGILRGQGLWLTLLAIAAIFVLIIVRRRFTYVGWLPRVALGLLLGGIAGNLTDRLKYGFVVDFLDFYIDGWHWPAFNVADSAICIGVILYLFDSFKRERAVSNKIVSAHSL